MDNLLHADLDPRARLIFGTPKMQCMAEGLTSDHDVALFVGYHAPAGGPGVLAHTFSSLFADVRLDGKSVSETDVNTLYAATQGVPVGLVTGDDIICGLVDAASRQPRPSRSRRHMDGRQPIRCRRRWRASRSEQEPSAQCVRPTH